MEQGILNPSLETINKLCDLNNFDCKEILYLDKEELKKRILISPDLEYNYKEKVKVIIKKLKRKLNVLMKNMNIFW